MLLFSFQVALLVYSLGGTAASLYLGRSLVGLNFKQEAQEANFRWAGKGAGHCACTAFAADSQDL